MLANVHLSVDDVTLRHADNREKPEQVQHLKYAQEHVIRVVDWSRPDNSRCLEQRTSHNSMS